MVFEALHLFFSLSLQPFEVLLSLLVRGPILGLTKKIDRDVVKVVHYFVEFRKHHQLKVLEVQAHKIFEFFLGLASWASNSIAHLWLKNVCKKYLQHLVKVHDLND